MESKCKQYENISQERKNIYEIQIIHKEGGGEDFCAVGWQLPFRKARKSYQWQKYFSAPLSSKDSPVELNLQAEIKRKFDSILRPNSELEKLPLITLRLKTEYSFLLMEKFDAYAQSLLNQNIIPLNEAMNNLKTFPEWSELPVYWLIRAMAYWKNFVTLTF